ncbi:MAG: 30S ribosomal protein S2 [Phycisphaerae bacterium]|nr:30S ribosomal protein S2 [Phycisphaerae bacterium]
MSTSAVVREMLDAGIHFGHRASRWNPKMKPFIYGQRNKIHIIDIRETLKGLLRAKKYIAQTVAQGGDILFVGTKRQARELLMENVERCKMHYVTERWLGGTLTNFRTIRNRLDRLNELETLAASPEWETGYSKKIKSVLTRELKKIQRNLSGIRRMTRLPAALVIIDMKKEMNAVREAQSLGIPTIGLLDTDGDPDAINIPIPGNDDSMRSIELVIRHLTDAIEEGFRGRAVEPPPAEGGDERGEGPQRGRRGRRSEERGPREAEAAAGAAMPMTPDAPPAS